MSGRKQKKQDIQGKWLREALAKQGVTVYRLAKELGYSREKFYRHINNKTYLSSESLAEIARKFPTMNMRFVLTGEGTPTL
ncbi:helix-turn-helix domain-containing protein [Spirosoma validum]|uniref:Helix-turn-helix transcriptional regulator n=1 Tax=Spirosoma validum TaxID=2771355 RepID=A0A927B640_9BACT|nr:helix-turn-helix transcriptional regulator [Spirosoma validum]MBD2755926.1 helix-turn-helix transcriptional regulator [Spirosoma validum]